ncbi:MAG TPA: hypothetical protein VF468_09120, partial [Actinomycetota bacterium]|nr:hypothetical protein [Actinomycetota bacterium]
GAVPVLCVPASPKGVADAQSVVTLLERLGLPAHHVTVAVVAVAGGRVPRRVLAGLTLLQARVAAIAHIPHDPWVRATGGIRIDRAGRPLRRAVTRLAATLTGLATSVTTEATAADALRSPGQQPGAAIAPDTTAAAATAVAASAALIHSR